MSRTAFASLADPSGVSQHRNYSLLHEPATQYTSCDHHAQEGAEIDVARVMLANVLHPMHEYEQALQQYDRALPAVRAAQGNSVLVRAALYGQAHCMAKLRNLEAAAATYQDAARLYQEVRCCL